MKKGVIIGVITILIIVFASFFIFNGESEVADEPILSTESNPTMEELETSTETTTPIAEPTETELQTHTIEITSSGFIPKEINIKMGDTITFINKDSREHRPASAQHPTHTAYPGSSIQKCGTPEASETFDSCHGLAQDETYSFTFNEVGEWGYHDHLRTTLLGKIIVE